MGARRTFAVGRVSGREMEIVLVDETAASPFPGPWSVKAVVRRIPASGTTDTDGHSHLSPALRDTVH